MIKRIVCCSALLMFLMAVQACAPPRDARGISESEFKGEVQTKPPTPAAGGGKSLKKNQW